MDLDVVFLGTSGSMPTARRAPAATLVRRGGERLLFDCAEGTQRQLLRSSIGLVELREIFLTHFHADHYLGLPGMLKTWSLHGRSEPLTVHGPRGLRRLLGSEAGLLGLGRLTFEVELVELAPGEVRRGRGRRAGDPCGPRARRAAARGGGDARRRARGASGRGARAAAAR